MVLITDTTSVGINVMIANEHSPMNRFFVLRTPLAEKRKRKITGLYISFLTVKQILIRWI